MICRISCCLLPIICLAGELKAQSSYDVVVYGGTSGGVTAAIEAARLGRSVLLIEPSQHLGGMTTGGLSSTDTGTSSAIQGTAREFYNRVATAYGERESSFRFEPHVAENVINAWVQQAGVTVIRGEQLNSGSGVVKSGSRIQSIAMTNGHAYSGSMFIDATYEGDLMAGSGVSYTVGREANSKYGERYNGVQTGLSPGDQFSPAVDPYVTPGVPSSGLLPGIRAGAPPGPDGSGDSGVQAYCYRLTMTQAANRLPWTAPAGYNPANYKLLQRQINAAGTTDIATLIDVSFGPLGHGGKFDVNNNGGISTDYVGANHAYPDADYATRAQIVAAHRSYEQGFLYFLSHDVKNSSGQANTTLINQMNSWGLAPDEFTDNGGWPHQLYVREARRMIGRHVMIESDCFGQTPVNDSVGLASYALDSHITQRYVNSDGHVQSEGGFMADVPNPYGVSYGSITPNESQASNLLVTSTLSASHSAYASIRMEPVGMEMGQAAGAAAALAIQKGVSVQQLPYSTLSNQLVYDGALLNWGKSYVGVARDDFNSATLGNVQFSSGGTGWNNNWSSTGTQKFVAGDLTTTRGGYVPLAPMKAVSGAMIQGTSSIVRQNVRSLVDSMGGEVWLSVLLQNPSDTAVAGISLNPTGSTDVANSIQLSGGQLSVRVKGGSHNVESLTPGNTHLILARLTIAESGNDTLALWADPANLASLGSPDFQWSASDLLTSLSTVGVLSYNPDGSGNGGYVDALRISNRLGGQGLIDVTSVPEPATAVLTLIAAAGLAGWLVLRNRLLRDPAPVVQSQKPVERGLGLPLIPRKYLKFDTSGLNVQVKDRNESFVFQLCD
jgi:hypothetical protein